MQSVHDPEDLYDQLLARGMTEQQIADLVAREIVKRRAAEEPVDERRDPGAMNPAVLAAELLSLLAPRADSKSEDGGRPTEANHEPQHGRRETAVAQRAAAALSGATDDSTQVVNGNAGLQTPLHSVLAQFESFTGPMPPPFLAQQYEQLVPGFTERTLVMLEKDAELGREIARQNSQR